MILPDRHEWLHSAKALLAALLALYITLALPLDNPYWAMASVYLVIRHHPLGSAVPRAWRPSGRRSLRADAAATDAPAPCAQV